MKRNLACAILSFYATLYSCTLFADLLCPKYFGVSPSAQQYVDKYLDLSARNGLHFTKTVSVGFTDIPDKRTIGMCNYGLTFREVDLDRRYWERSSKLTRKMLIFHELTHCYCGREHDFAKGKLYPAPNRGSAFDPVRNLLWITTWKSPGEGFFKDGCPLSIMHPVLVDDSCAEQHYDQYIKEMFDRCQPY